MRSLKGVLVSAFLFSSAVAWADVGFQSLRIENDGTFELRLTTTKGPAVFKDRDLQANGQTVSKRSGPVAVDLVRYADHPLVTLAVTVNGEENGAVFVLKGGDNGDYAALNEQPIIGKKASLSTDLADVLEGLARTKGKDSSIILEALVNHFSENREDDLFSYANGFENGVDTAMREAQKKAVPAPKARKGAPPAAVEDDSPGGDGSSDQPPGEDPVGGEEEQQQAEALQQPEQRRERVKIRRPYGQARPNPGYYGGYPPGYGSPYYGGYDPRQPQGWGW